MKMKAKTLFTIIIEKDEDGYVAYCPQLQGCYAQGDSYKEVMSNIEDAMRLHTEDETINRARFDYATGDYQTFGNPEDLIAELRS